MRATGVARRLAYLLRWIGLRWRVRGIGTFAGSLFPLNEQSGIIERITLGGKTYDAHLDSYIDWMAFFFGAYERDLLEALQECFGPFNDKVILDVGANVGHHSLWFGACGATVHAFEPAPILCDRIAARITENPDVNIVVHPVGLGDSDVIRTFYPANAINEGQGSFKVDQAGSGAPPLELRIQEGDRWLEKHGITDLALVKVDVEGLEPEVLSGLRSTLERDRPVIVCEIGPLNRDEFPTLAAVRALLPEHYEIRYLRSSGIFIRSRKFETLEEDAFKSFAGNLVAFPAACS